MITTIVFLASIQSARAAPARFQLENSRQYLAAYTDPEANSAEDVAQVYDEEADEAQPYQLARYDKGMRTSKVGSTIGLVSTGMVVAGGVSLVAGLNLFWTAFRYPIVTETLVLGGAGVLLAGTIGLPVGAGFMNFGVSMMGRDAVDHGVDVQPVSIVGWVGFGGAFIPFISIPSLIVSYGAAAIKKGQLRRLHGDFARAKPLHINVSPWVQGPTVGLGLRSSF